MYTQENGANSPIGHATVNSESRTGMSYARLGSLLAAAVVLSGVASTCRAEGPSYSPYVLDSYPKRVFWGDTHLHTSLSVDANRDGDKYLGPAEAYRFARGEAVTAHNGMQVRLRRPLDFLVVSDHAEGLGVMRDLNTADPRLLATEQGRILYGRFREIQDAEGIDQHTRLVRMNNEVVKAIRADEDVRDFGYRHYVWDDVTALADRYNDPGRFTAFIGFEWTPGAIHRVVIFRDNADKASRVLPFSEADSSNPEDLWRYLENYQAKTGGEVLAIPHNGNLSAGKQAPLVDSYGKPLTAAYATTRSRWEPLLEVTQIKGTSETHPLLSVNDEFADYEIWDFRSESKDPKIEQYGYARSILKNGLAMQDKLGVNPFKFGMVGGTDAHTSLSTADEDNFWGKMTLGEPSPIRIFEPTSTVIRNATWNYSAAGYTAVWAQENTRQSLFDAMKRKEVYASTGPRITVRFFGGWDYDANDALRPDFARIGYAKGVPMGGSLTAAPSGISPRFMIRAMRDPEGAYLDRIQVIKGWRSVDGDLHEKIFNVVLSGNRIIDADGSAPPVGNTVNVDDASYTNSIGAQELAVVWEDPDFDRRELAFYYLRVIEIPTPRWTAYDAKYFQLTTIPDDVPMITQERAFSSPIWYVPCNTFHGGKDCQ
jgi:Protein of unknown function (DUF3604)